MAPSQSKIKYDVPDNRVTLLQEALKQVGSFKYDTRKLANAIAIKSTAAAKSEWEKLKVQILAANTGFNVTESEKKLLVCVMDQLARKLDHGALAKATELGGEENDARNNTSARWTRLKGKLAGTGSAHSAEGKAQTKRMRASLPKRREEARLAAIAEKSGKNTKET